MPDSPMEAATAASSPTDALLGFVEHWRDADLPDAVVSSARQVTLDTLACYVGGTALEAGRLLLAFAERSRGDVRLFPLRGSASAEAASYASASIGNLLDADETLYNRGHHACAIVLPVLVVGSQHGRSVREAIRAIAVGFEVAARISLSWSYYTLGTDGQVRGAAVTGLSWIAPGLAMALGYMRGLSEAAMRSAFGTACYSAPIPTNSNWHVTYPLESMTKYTQYGAIAQAAVSSVELAALGYVGPGRVLDGPHGFRRLIGATEWEDRVLSEGIPGTWAVCETGLKRYPACRLWHGALGGLEQLVLEHDLESRDIEHVEVRLPLLHPNQRRLAEEQPPLTELSAQFSVPYGCAQVLQRTPPGPSWYRAEALESPDTKQLMRRIAVSVDPALNRTASDEVRRVGHYGFKLPWAVTLTTRSGRQLEASGVNAPGDPFVDRLRITPAQTADKFRLFYEQAHGRTAPESVLGLLEDDTRSCAELLDALWGRPAASRAL